MSNQDIIGFYNGVSQNQIGMSIRDVENMDYDQMENDHYYIQWIFPLPEKSQAVPTSPVLTKGDIEQFREDEKLRHTMVKMILKMLGFYGLKLNTMYEESIVKGDDFKERVKNWITPKNHNFLRLTRMIRSTKLLGLDAWANALYSCLCSIYEEYGNIIGSTTKKFWDEAILY
jgi:hypothetical protein